jgi:Xaa-Pro aminopeptidase
MTTEAYTAHDLERFRDVQRLAYECAVDVAKGLEPGVTEREAAAQLRASLVRRGVSVFFHAPFAWFGDRTAFTGFRSPLDFFPTARRLERGMPAILDVGPTLDGYAADIGYAFSCGPCPELDRARDDLKPFRSLILSQVRAERSMRDIYEEVDRLLLGLGYRNCHAAYPFHVLGHKVGRLPLRALRFSLPSIGGFDPRTTLYLYKQLALSKLSGSRHKTPLWNRSARAAVSAEPGLWAIEPHIGKGGVGAKWEEILVVTAGDAYWLDDDLPHVRYWSARPGENTPHTLPGTTTSTLSNPR